MVLPAHGGSVKNKESMMENRFGCGGKLEDEDLKNDALYQPRGF
jgi:hypothetical protein